MEIAVAVTLALGTPIAISTILWLGLRRFVSVGLLMRMITSWLAPALVAFLAYAFSGSNNVDGDKYPAVTAIIIVWLLMSGAAVVLLEGKWGSRP